jgi:modulator of FtsH protease HflC
MFGQDHHRPKHHAYDYDDDDHDHDDHHDHDHLFGTTLSLALRTAFATLILAAAVVAACIVMIPAGEAEVITRFGNPNRVLAEPGLAWKLPVPFEVTIPVDLRLRTTSTGLQDVGTQDGLRVLMQAYVGWRVSSEPDHVRQFLRSVRNEPDEAARQVRSFVSAALHVTASNFGLADLVNGDEAKVRLDVFEQQLRGQVADRMLQVYGIEISEIGIQQLTLPKETLAATVDRMRAERETVAAERTAEGLRRAAEIRSNADREGREVVAKAREEAAQIEADAEQEAARIHADAYQGDPDLYTLLRSLDTIDKVVGRNTSIMLRTDAAPFRVLVDGPVGTSTARGPVSAAPAASSVTSQK